MPALEMPSQRCGTDSGVNMLGIGSCANLPVSRSQVSIFLTDRMPCDLWLRLEPTRENSLVSGRCPNGETWIGTHGGKGMLASVHDGGVADCINHNDLRNDGVAGEPLRLETGFLQK
jgi:hypothetical protein